MDMKLQRLTGLEREKIEQEFQELEIKIRELKAILADENKIYEIMKKELSELKEKYNDSRRTSIEDERLDIDMEDLIKDEKVLITITNKGYVKRIELISINLRREVEKEYQHSIQLKTTLYRHGSYVNT